MDRRIRTLGLILVVCFCLLFLQLNNWQVRQSSALQSSTFEQFAQTRSNPFTQSRGDILSSNGTVLAESTATNDGYGQLRKYPLGALTEDVTGYYDTTQSSDSGIEAFYNNYLAPHQSTANNIHQLLTEHTGVDNVVTTLSTKLQQTAQAALDGKIGAVVAINPQNGDILAMYANPTFNPNVLASHDVTTVAKAYKTLQDLSDQQNSPLLNGVTQRTTPPGSTMKVITTSAMFDHDPQLTTKVWPAIHLTALPDTNRTLSNFQGEKCGGDLQTILEKSCDTAYGLIGIQLGAQSLASEATSFGFNSVPPIDLEQFGSTEAVAAVFPTLKSLQGNLPFVAYSAIGQFDVSETALQNALIAAGIANNGVIMTPHLMSHIFDDQGTLVESYTPHPWKTATSATTANEVRSLMLGVATSGTAAGLFPSSDDVAAKTGTAETQNSCSANWLIATAPAGTFDTPTIAVAAVVPYQPGLGCGETGATVAGPIVSKVLQEGLREHL